MTTTEKATREVVALTGNEASAWAMKLANVRVGVFFPIGPADEVMETFRILIDKGIADARILQMENEKASVSAQIGLSRVSVRSAFAGCTEGLLWPAAEIRYASGARLPMLFIIPNRGLEPPTTVYSDHEDFFMQRDTGWLMFHCEDSQDIVDTILQAYRIMEDRKVLLPAFVGYDGWEISHGVSRVTMPTQEEVNAFLPPFPIREEGDYPTTDWYEIFKLRRAGQSSGGHHMELKFLQAMALEEAEKLIPQVGEEYGKLLGSKHTGFFDDEGCEDADVILISMGVYAPFCRFAAEAYRAKGLKVGSLKLRVFRPFPGKALAEAVKNAKLVMVLERNPRASVSTELKAAIYNHLIMEQQAKHIPMVMARIAGIGGRRLTFDGFARIMDSGFEAIKTGKYDASVKWEGVDKVAFEYDPLKHHCGD